MDIKDYAPNRDNLLVALKLFLVTYAIPIIAVSYTVIAMWFDANAIGTPLEGPLRLLLWPAALLTALASIPLYFLFNIVYASGISIPLFLFTYGITVAKVSALLGLLVITVLLAFFFAARISAGSEWKKETLKYCAALLVASLATGFLLGAYNDTIGRSCTAVTDCKVYCGSGGSVGPDYLNLPAPFLGMSGMCSPTLNDYALTCNSGKCGVEKQPGSHVEINWR